MFTKSSRVTLTFALFAVILVLFVETACAQDDASHFIALSGNETIFVGKAGITGLTRTVNIIGLTDETVTVTLYPSELYDNKSGRSISPSKFNINPNSFPLTRNNVATVNISLDTSDLSEGNYLGTIIVTAANATSIELANINVTVRIESGYSSVISLIFLLTIAILTAVAFALGELRHVGKFLVVVFGMAAVTLWLLSVYTSSFLDPGNIIATVLIGNLVGYIVYYVKDEREENRDLEKTSREIRNKGLGTDIELIRNLLGEITAHYTSFTSPYFKSGSISRKIWDASAKQGVVSDLPTYRLEKYYSFVDVYNRYYSRAIKLLKEKKREDVPKAEFDFSLFESFRKQYAELEKTIFVNLQYDLGLVTTMCLSPQRTEYPRISRALLYELVDCDVLKPRKDETKETYKTKIKDWDLKSHDFEKIAEEIYRGGSTHKFLGHVDKQFNDRYKELREIVERLPLLSEENSEPQKPAIKGAFALDFDTEKENNK